MKKINPYKHVDMHPLGQENVSSEYEGFFTNLHAIAATPLSLKCRPPTIFMITDTDSINQFVNKPSYSEDAIQSEKKA